MAEASDRAADLLASWRTNSRVTAFLVENLPQDLWQASVPAVPRRTIRMIAAHLHNIRCRWIRTLGLEHGVAVPSLVNLHKVTRGELLAALPRSSRGIAALLQLGIAQGGRLPPSKLYVWRNLPLDVAHVLTYFVAHEGHHRGQILQAARQLGQRLPAAVVNGLWAWNLRSKE
jgi:uncharacterized damage-inducible protein DinB